MVINLVRSVIRYAGS